MNDFKPPKLYWDEIRALTKKIREQFLNKPDQIPVPIENIIEFKLGITIDPQPFLKEEFGIDGQILSDLTTIMIDSKMYSDDKSLPRVRFTLAHELGHFYLHKEQIKKARFSSVKEWIKFRQSISEEDISWFESQADEFAGSLLVPKNKLIELLEAERNKIEKYITTSNSEESQERAITALSQVLCGKFQVSFHVIETRIRKEKLWKELGFENI
jgi:hypothetical protein